MRVPTAVLISGTGSNMVALAEAAASPDYPADIRLVISNRPKAAGLAKAQSLGLETRAIDHKSFPNRENFEAALDKALREHGIQLVALAGFMRVLTPWFVSRWRGHLINIHPSLLPKHKGLHTHSRALEAGDRDHGASVHWVSEELDAGDLIAQRAFRIPADANPEMLAAMIKPLEHDLYPEALGKAARHVAVMFTPG